MYSTVAKVLWTLYYASPEEIPELQRPRRATGNRRNLQCGDDSIMRAKATQDTGSPCLGAVGPRSGRSALLVVDFSVLVSCSAHWAWVEWPSAPGSGGVTLTGILFMTWWAQGVMNGWLLVIIIIIIIIKNVKIRVTLSWITLQGHFTELLK